MSAQRATYVDVPLDSLAEGRRVRVYVTPAVVEAVGKEQKAQEYTEYQNHTFVMGGNKSMGAQVPVSKVSITTLYEVYFLGEDGRKVRRTFTVNPEFIEGYRAVLVDVGLEGHEERQALSVRNLETGSTFNWPAVPQGGVTVFQSMKWERGAYLATVGGGLAAIVSPFVFGPLFLAGLAVMIRNKMARKKNNGIRNELQTAAADLLQRFK